MLAITSHNSCQTQPSLLPFPSASYSIQASPHPYDSPSAPPKAVLEEGTAASALSPTAVLHLSWYVSPTASELGHNVLSKTRWRQTLWAGHPCR